MWIWITIMIIEAALIATLVFIVRNLWLQNEQLTEFSERALSNAVATYLRMKRIDSTGAFEHEDEVGITFRELLLAVRDYATFLGVDEEILREEEARIEKEIKEETSATEEKEG